MKPRKSYHLPQMMSSETLKSEKISGRRTEQSEKMIMLERWERERNWLYSNSVTWLRANGKLSCLQMSNQKKNLGKQPNTVTLADGNGMMRKKQFKSIHRRLVLPVLFIIIILYIIIFRRYCSLRQWAYLFHLSSCQCQECCVWKDCEKHISTSRCLKNQERREGRLKCKELPWCHHGDQRGVMEKPVTGWETCDVDVSLSAMADNLLKSNSSHKCSLFVCVQTYECVHSLVCLTVFVLSFAHCVGVCQLFVGVFFDFNVSKEGAACSKVTGWKTNRPN